MTADALAILRETAPEYVIRFAELVYSDAQLDVNAAAAAVGMPGKAKELLLDRRVQMALSTIGGELRETFREQRQMAVAMLARMLVADPRDMFDRETRQWIHPTQWPDSIAACVTAIEETPDGRFKVKLQPRLEIIKTFLAVFNDLEGGGGPAVQAQARVIMRGSLR